MTFGIVAIVCVLLAALAWRSQEVGEAPVLEGSSCPSCSGPTRELTDGVSSDPPRAWQLVACQRCDWAATTVHGVPSQLAYCPACRQRALKLHTHRLADGRAQVDEHCQICGHQARATVPEVVQDLPKDGEGNVIPFRRRGS